MIHYQAAVTATRSVMSRPAQVRPAGTLSRHGALNKAATACCITHFAQWFDYAAYGLLATVLTKVFFPASSPVSGLLAAFSVLALSCLVHPFGAAIWGCYGDQKGRKSALSLSTLLLALASLLLALLPTYAQIGFWAPALLLLLRIVQGFAASATYAGAAVLLAEYAPNHQRGVYTSIGPASTAAGLLLASLLVMLMQRLLTEEQIASFGWRLPFLLAAAIGLVGRARLVGLEDSANFREVARCQQVCPAPLRQLLRTQKRALLIAASATMLNVLGLYTMLSYLPAYLTAQLQYSAAVALMATSIALATYIGLIFVMGKLSDQLGRKTLLITASLMFMVLAVPLLRFLGTASFAGMLVILIVFGAMLAMNDATLPGFLAELFPTNIRYSGVALSFNLSNAVFGATAPLVATWLIQRTGDLLAPAWYLVGAALVSMMALLFSRESAGTLLPER